VPFTMNMKNYNKPLEQFDAVIIGAGASGLAAAITLKRENPALSVVVLEKNGKPGRKLLATGNGRCNLSNEACCEVNAVRSFFSSLGVLTFTDEEGRVYPFNRRAESVVGALLRECEALGADIRCSQEVVSIERTEVSGRTGFAVHCAGRSFQGEKVLIATGGKAAPSYGTTGDGYRLARELGHSITRLAPALTSFNSDVLRESGYRASGMIRLLKDGNIIAEEAGEIQLGSGVVSGICAMNLSSLVTIYEKEKPAEGIARYSLSIDFMPQLNYDEVYSIMKDFREKGLTASAMLSSIVDEITADEILKDCGVQQLATGYAVSDEELVTISERLKDYRIRITNLSGWQKAQVTRGGVRLSEVDSLTMESVGCQGLYFSGEILDYNGPCGGFNLNNAWVTGMKAGRAMAR